MQLPIAAWSTLLVVAVLEVGGDAIVRKGLRGARRDASDPRPGCSFRELPCLNEMIHRRNRRRALEAVLRDDKAYRDRVIALIEPLSNADLVTLSRFSWAGPSWTPGDYRRASTAAHYGWARRSGFDTRRGAHENGLMTLGSALIAIVVVAFGGIAGAIAGRLLPPEAFRYTGFILAPLFLLLEALLGRLAGSFGNDRNVARLVLAGALVGGFYAAWLYVRQ